jgi:hypothetical protein
MVAAGSNPMIAGSSATHITAAEYARQCDPPMGKPAMSRLFKAGLPNYPGKDAHGRDCKFVDPVEADRWRASFCIPKMDGRTGLLRGAPSLSSAPATGASAAVRPDLPRADPKPASPGGTAGGAGADQQSIALRIQEARATSAEEDALKRTYQRQALEGQLLDRAAAVDAHLRFVGLVASSLDRMPADNATALSKQVGCTEHEAFVALRAVTERLREDLARAARQEAARLKLDTAQTAEAA